MPNATSVSLTFSCPVPASELRAAPGGHYCRQCDKHVHDYTLLSDRELLGALRQNPTGCGSFRPDQLDRELAKGELQRRGYPLAAIALLLALQLASIGNTFAQTAEPSAIEATVGRNAPTEAKTASSVLQTSTPTIVRVLGDGEALIGASVAILDLDGAILGGDITDTLGAVTLSLPASADRVRVSYLGFRSEEFFVEELSAGALNLRSISTQLDAVVVRGYTTTNRDNVLGGYVGVQSREFGLDSRDTVAFATAPEAGALFPNPSRGQASLRLPASGHAQLVNVYDAAGRLVLSLVPDEYATEVSFDIGPRHPEGTYFVVRVDADGARETEPLVVVR